MTDPSLNGTTEYRISQLERRVSALASLPQDLAIVKLQIQTLLDNDGKREKQLTRIFQALGAASLTFATLAVTIWTHLAGAA